MKKKTKNIRTNKNILVISRDITQKIKNHTIGNSGRNTSKMSTTVCFRLSLARLYCEKRWEEATRWWWIYKHLEGNIHERLGRNIRVIMAKYPKCLWECSCKLFSSKNSAVRSVVYTDIVLSEIRSVTRVVCALSYPRIAISLPFSFSLKYS